MNYRNALRPRRAVAAVAVTLLTIATVRSVHHPTRACAAGPRQSAAQTARNYCYLRSVRLPPGKTSGGTLVADYVEWGEDAEGIALIRNRNPRLRTLSVAPNARVFLVTNPQGVIEKRRISLADFAALWNGKKPAPADVYFGAGGRNLKKELYSVAVARGGTVTEIRHEYQP